MSAVFALASNNSCIQAIKKGLELLKSPNDDIYAITVKDEEGFVNFEITNCIDNENAYKTGIGACKTAHRGYNKNRQTPVSNNIYCVAINGYIDNFEELKIWCNPTFEVNTQEELLLALLCVTDMSNKFEMMKKLQSLIKGAPSFAFMSCREEAVYAICGINPLYIGYGNDGYYISSEVNGLSLFCKKFTTAKLGDIIKITKDKATILNSDLKKVKRTVLPTPSTVFYNNDLSLEDEIYHSILAVKNFNKRFLTKSDLNLKSLNLSRHFIEKIKRIVIVCDSHAYSVGLCAISNFEKYCDIPTTAILSQEMRYNNCILNKSVLVIALSFYGENTDTLACVMRSKNCGAKVIAITSNKYSSLALCCEYTLYNSKDFNCYNGISSISYIMQYLSISYLALEMSKHLGFIDSLPLGLTVKMAELLPGRISSALNHTQGLDLIAKKLCKGKNIFVTAFGNDYGIAVEINDKINEICHINSTCLNTCVLTNTVKNLTDTTIFAIVCHKENIVAVTKNLIRCKALGSDVIILTTEGIAEDMKSIAQTIIFNDNTDIFNAIPIVAGVFKACIITRNYLKNLPSSQTNEHNN